MLRSRLFLLFYFLFLFGARNPLIFGDASLTVVLYAVIALSDLMFLLLIFRRKVMPLLLLPFVCLAVLLFPSVVLSEFPDVSIFKFLIFLGALFAIIQCLQHSDSTEVRRLLLVYRYLLNSNRLVLFLSLIIFLFLDAYGYPRNETGFSGVFKHPQLFGVFLAISTILEVNYYILFGKRLNLLVAAISFSMIYFTESRTAFFSVLITLTAGLVVYLFRTQRFSAGSISKKGAILISSIFILFSLSDVLGTMLSKHGRAASSIAEAVEASRGRLALASLSNFMDKPVYGTGFQISNGKYGLDPMVVERDRAFNLPIKASVEKGVFWTAVLGETGLLGMLGVTIMISSIMVFSGWSYVTANTVCVVLLCSFGESMLFSMGSIGLYCWMVILLSSWIGRMQNKGKFV